MKLVRASLGAALAVTIAGRAAAAPDAALPVSHSPAHQPAAEATGAAPNRDAVGSDPAPSRNAARSRMRECGHQWSAMKKSGAASGTTWKDFSQGCLAKQ